MKADKPGYIKMSSEEKNELIEKLWEENENLRKKLEKYERPKKTPKNSSLPPSQTEKGEIKRNVKRSSNRKAHRQGGRALSENPDEIIIARVKQCAYCQAELSEARQTLDAVYDKIDLPEIKAYVRRIERYAAKCPCCQKTSRAPVPQGLEAGSPFGQRIQTLALYYRYVQIIGYRRLREMFAEVFGLEISEGGLANVFARSRFELAPEVAAILQRLQRSRLVASDETSARVSAKNEWEWVFQNEAVCLHIIRPSRGADVISEVMQAHKPEIWVSDLYSAQTKHPAQAWQVCLAHQLRDTQYAIDAGDRLFAPHMKRLLLRAFLIHKNRYQLLPSCLESYRQNLHKRFEYTLTLEPTSTDGKRLKKRYLKLKDTLFLFLTDSTIPPTNNASEQALRMSKVFRKVTNCFRSTWGRDLFADMRSIINTGKRQNLSAFQAISTALDPKSSLLDSS